MMPRLSVDLSEETHLALKLQAVRSKRPAADIVRGLIESYLEGPQTKIGADQHKPAKSDVEWGTTTISKPTQKIPDLSKTAQAKGKMGR